jgi:prepilin-type N-terminal cleavage/methylation domain-containing protein
MRSSSSQSLSNRSHCSRVQYARNGFTLLEVCIVLFIVGVLFAVSVPPAAHLFDEEKLRKPIRELQTFARTARRNAMMENRPYEVLLLNGSYLLRPVDEKKDANNAEQTYNLPSDVTFAIKRLGERGFLKQTDGTWLFGPDGICEPMNFIFQRKGDWVRFQVDPLTATIQNEESFIQ